MRPSAENWQRLATDHQIAARAGIECFPDLLLRAVAILNRRNVNGNIETTNRGSRCKHFRLAYVFAKIALCRDVRHIHYVKIEQLNTRSANSSSKWIRQSGGQS